MKTFTTASSGDMCRLSETCDMDGMGAVCGGAVVCMYMCILGV